MDEFLGTCNEKGMMAIGQRRYLINRGFPVTPQQPHGGRLVNKVLTGQEREEALARAAGLPMIMVDLEAVITIEMIATGVLSPNEGFMNEADYKSVLQTGRLANGLVWPVPLSFAPTGDRNKEVVDRCPSAMKSHLSMKPSNRSRS